MIMHKASAPSFSIFFWIIIGGWGKLWTLQQASLAPDCITVTLYIIQDYVVLRHIWSWLMFQIQFVSM